MVPSSTALAASITLTSESDTFVRASDPTVAHGTETSFDVFGAASSYGCGTGPAAGLLRFNLAGIPAGATITGATLKLTSKTGFAFDGDPDHHAIFLPNDSWSESAVTWNTRPPDGVVQQVPPAEWLLNGLPLSTSPDKLGSTSAFEAVGCAGTHVGEQELRLCEPSHPRCDRAVRRRQALARGLHDPLRDAVQRRLPEREAQAVVLPALLQQGGLGPERSAARGRLRAAAAARDAEPDPRRLDGRYGRFRDRPRRRRVEPAPDAGRVDGADVHRGRAPRRR